MTSIIPFDMGMVSTVCIELRYRCIDSRTRFLASKNFFFSWLQRALYSAKSSGCCDVRWPTKFSLRNGGFQYLVLLVWLHSRPSSSVAPERPSHLQNRQTTHVTTLLCSDCVISSPNSSKCFCWNDVVRDGVSLVFLFFMVCAMSICLWMCRGGWRRRLARNCARWPKPNQADSRRRHCTINITPWRLGGWPQCTSIMIFSLF